MDFSAIHQEAKAAAVKAAQEVYDRLGGDRMACGFAWVKVRGVRGNTRLGKSMTVCGFKSSYTKGLDLWNPSGSPVQNVDIKEAGAEAYAEVLRKHGIDAVAQSRLD